MSATLILAPSPPEVAHLSIEQLVELHSRYLSGEKLAALFAYFDIQSTRISLHSLLPMKYLDKSCPVGCNPLQQKWATKTSGESAPFCKPCSHVETRSCSCKVCHTSRIDAYNGHWATHLIPYWDLNLRDKILLMAFIWSEDHVNGSINPYIDAGAFSTSHTACWGYIKELHAHGAIKLVFSERRQSDIESSVDYRLEATKWRANVAGDKSHLTSMPIRQLLTQLRSDLDADIGLDDEEALVTLIRENALEEAFQYSVSQLYLQNLDMTADAKTREVLRDLLETTPLESVFAAAWQAAKSVKKALDDKVANSRRHASNMFPNAIVRLAAARARKPDAWTVDRKSADVSRISRVLHDHIFGGNDLFFSWPLSRYHAEVIMPRLISSTKSSPSQKPHAASVRDRPRSASEIITTAFPWALSAERITS
ncbi:hypothetical protein PSYJA_11520 [Pseudomonas syringae pv. japonica str. M301072]|uniref:Uncharacterized protein n=1 Tax=Pseudomonas syringae pv. japonica str. M301072 TaxID=629262 RepID=F3FH78_PSESX|nr:hypothetical protein PSYJA_11520 [Pseudomonas syringae pv. japonica str. M301072]